MAGIYRTQFQGTDNPITPSMQSFVYEVVASSQEVLLAPAHETRKGLMIYNDSIYKLFIKFAPGVSSTSFTVVLLPRSTYEMSQTIMYGGDIFAVWEEADGTAHVTELL